MRRFQPILFACLLVALVADPAPLRAATPSSGTINDLNLSLSYAGGGPYTGGNPSNNFPDATGPDCGLVPNTCDDFALTVNLSPAYLLANPNHRIVVRIDWDGSNPANDFDLYVVDGSNTNKVPPSATSGNPETVALPLVNGTCTVRTLVFSAANVNYNATITVGPPPVLRAGTYIQSTDNWSCNTHLEGIQPLDQPPPTVFDHGNDGEPAVRFDPNGTAWITGIAGVPAGSALWSTADACGQSYRFHGAPDAGLGGGDAEIEISPEPNLLGFHNIMMSSLTLANLTTSVSVDGGATFTVQPISTITPVVDRQWNASYGANTFYLSYRNGATQPGNFLEVVRWDNGGLGTPGAGPFVIWGAGVDPLTSKDMGNMTCDQRPGANAPIAAGPNGEGNVYHTWSENNGQKVWVSRSTNFGVTWSHHLVIDGGAGASFNHLFTWVAVDRAGNVYCCFSDDHNVYYSVSTNQATTWSAPVRVNAGGPSRTAIFAEMQAGSAGKVMFTFYGHGGFSSQDPGANWKVFVSRCQNALDPVPTFEEKIVSDRTFHTGPVCQDGLNCACCRELTECYEIDINPVDGSALVCYGAFGAGGLYITRQISGKSSIDGKTVVDRSTTCPNPLLTCSPPLPPGNPCAKPGITVVTDADAEDVPPAPSPASNIQEVSLAEPFGDPRGANLLLWRIKVQDLDTSALPPNTFWRVIWDTPGGFGRYYVRVVNCATGGLSADYGHFTTGSVQDGPADHFTVNNDGEICIWIQKSKVGNPTAGQTLTAVNADCRQVAGVCPGSPAAFAPLDVTNSGAYQVVGNGACAPPTVACPADFTAPPVIPPSTPIDYPLTFTVNNPSTVSRTFLVTVTDENNWLLGGPTVGPVGPVAPGGSAPVNVTVRMDPQCRPDMSDVITFSVVAQDNSSLAASCTTNVGCDNPVPGELAVELAAVAVHGGVELSWTSHSHDITGFHINRGTGPDAPERVTREPIRMGSGGAFTWRDRIDQPVESMHYRLVGVFRDGTERLVGVTSVSPRGRILSLRLVGANPVRQRAVFEYALPAPGSVVFEIYGINGGRVRTLVDRAESAGSHSVTFDLRSDDGRPLGSGVYLARMAAGGETRSVKMVVVE